MRSTTAATAIPWSVRRVVILLSLPTLFLRDFVVPSKGRLQGPLEKEAMCSRQREIVSVGRRARTKRSKSETRVILYYREISERKPIRTRRCDYIYTGRSIPHKPIRLNVLVNFGASLYYMVSARLQETVHCNPLSLGRCCIIIIFVRGCIGNILYSPNAAYTRLDL